MRITRNIPTGWREKKTINKVTAVYKLIRSQTEQTHVINKKKTGI